MGDRAAWERGWTEAYVWRCGDDVCDCSVPVVESVTPNRAAGYPWIHRVRLWEGPYHTAATRPERAAQLRALRAAARRLSVPITGR